MGLCCCGGKKPMPLINNYNIKPPVRKDNGAIFSSTNQEKYYFKYVSSIDESSFSSSPSIDDNREYC